MQQLNQILLSIGCGVAAFCTTSLAQEMPTKQPNVLSIVREQVKMGHNAAHARNEQGWPAALGKAKHPYGYVALTSISGPNEAWYVTPYESHAKMGDDFKRAEDDPVLSAELDRLSMADAEHVSATSTIHAVARPDLSYGEFPNPADMRVFDVTIYTIRPGHDAEFDEAAKAYGTARKRAGVKSSYRIYSVVAGLPAPALLVFTSAKDFAQWDKGFDEHTATMKAATDKEKEAIEKAMREAVLKEESNRFRLDPKQSYVSKETRDKDPAFWNPK